MGRQLYCYDASFCWTNGVGNSSGSHGGDAGGHQLKTEVGDDGSVHSLKIYLFNPLFCVFSNGAL